ncbi:MAG: prepilin-type N-terminal cleavage/methylation domain-containing protein [Sulfurimonas sp.]|jgi:prepilin-type N-terminal cleavage/methylation domain-containing protein|nr:prepilin-type N-terminal cleavage/methylation domain-containing protein [Sulfurimonas sp.]
MRLYSLKKAFTLIEVLISIVLLGIMFTYVHTIINSIKVQNNRYLEKADTIHSEQRIFNLLSLDIAEATSTISISHASRYDLISLKTQNSIYEIINPNILYFVSKKDNALIRVESLEALKLDNKEQITQAFLYADILTTDTQSFKVSQEGDFVTIMLRAPSLKPMVFQIPTTN